MEKVKTVAVNLVVIAVISIVLIWGDTLYRQHVEFDKGEKAFAAGNFIASVAGYESCIHMYTPGSSLMEKSSEKLWTLGEIAERRGDLERALVAYRALRSSWYAVVWLYQPGEDWIKKCDGRIGQLVQMRAKG